MSDLGVQPHIVAGAVQLVLTWAGMAVWALLALGVWAMIRRR